MVHLRCARGGAARTRSRNGFIVILVIVFVSGGPRRSASACARARLAVAATPTFLARERCGGGGGSGWRCGWGCGTERGTGAASRRHPDSTRPDGFQIEFSKGNDAGDPPSRLGDSALHVIRQQAGPDQHHEQTPEESRHHTGVRVANGARALGSVTQLIVAHIVAAAQGKQEQHPRSRTHETDSAVCFRQIAKVPAAGRDESRTPGSAAQIRSRGFSNFDTCTSRNSNSALESLYTATGSATHTAWSRFGAFVAVRETGKVPTKAPH